MEPSEPKEPLEPTTPSSPRSDFVWSSDEVTRSMATGPGLPADLPFLLSGGQQFGGFQIVRPLGKGGMGQVYEAEEIDSGRRVALKLLSRGLGDDEERERFLREGRLAASLSHPNCVYVFGTSEIQGFPVIAMELVPHGTLKELVVPALSTVEGPALSRVEGPGSAMSAAAAVDAILQVIAGLDAAAAVGILHRDIKPSNCFVHRDGRVLVGDFGLSVAARHGQTAGTILGTPGFASPEQLRGDPLDVRSDIYSVGATLFYLLAGRPPFDDRNTTDLLTKVASQPAPSLTTLRPDLPRRLAQAVSRCLAKTREERYPDYASLSAALEPFSSAQLKYAPIIRRSIAGWIDKNITAVAIVALVRLLSLQPLSPSRVADGAFATLIAIAVIALYYGLLEGHWGAGAGKALFGLRVADADGVPPGVRRGIHRALAFAVPAQVIVFVVREVVLRIAPAFSLQLLDSIAVTAYLVVLFGPARRANGFLALHDRFSGTRVVRRRTVGRAFRPGIFRPGSPRAERSSLEEHAPFEGAARVGPYLVPLSTPVGGASIVSVEGFDDRLHRRVWIELLPAGSAPLAAARRDLDRSSRLRWLGGKRGAGECWDAYEAVDGAPIDDVASTSRPWTTVRHWMADLAREIAAGLADGSLPPLRPESVWIGRDDRARLVEWRRCDGALSRISGEPADLTSAQRLLYGVAVAALLGVTVEQAMQRPPETPLPLHARTLLLSLRDAKFASADALLEAASAALASPPQLSRERRAGQIAAAAAFPVIMTAITVVGVLWVGKREAAKPESTEVARLLTWVGFWALTVGAAAGMAVVTAVFNMLGALILGSGFTFRPFGAALVNRRGQRASRLRALWRAVVTWTPVFAILFVLKLSPNPPDYRVGLLTLNAGLAALVVGGIVWAIYHPSRSLQDRLAGTRVVPR